MKLIIAGSRTLDVSKYFIRDVLKNFGLDIKHPEQPSEVVSGAASGIDKAGERCAKDYHIPIKQFPADWDTHGKAAGPIRNKQMAEYADALLLIWTGCEKTSKGSANMKKEMLKLGKPIYEVIIRKSPA